jgi:hypothetical protein
MTAARRCGRAWVDRWDRADVRAATTGGRVDPLVNLPRHDAGSTRVWSAERIGTCEGHTSETVLPVIRGLGRPDHDLQRLIGVG